MQVRSRYTGSVVRSSEWFPEEYKGCYLALRLIICVTDCFSLRSEVMEERDGLGCADDIEVEVDIPTGGLVISETSQCPKFLQSLGNIRKVFVRRRKVWMMGQEMQQAKEDQLKVFDSLSWTGDTMRVSYVSWRRCSLGVKLPNANRTYACAYGK